MLTREEILPLKAYLAQDEYEGKVLFAASLEDAERLTDFDVSRAEQYDEYASLGFVPTKVLREVFSWSFDCHHCSARIDDSLEVEDEELGEWRDINPVCVGQAIYCCPECNDKENVEHAKQLVVATELRAGLLSGWPGVTPGICAVFNTPPRIYFRFPGGKCDASWDLGANHIQIMAYDAAAYEAYKASLPSPSPLPPTEKEPA